MAYSQKFNPKLRALRRERDPMNNGFIEGEHFTDRCPDWCEPLQGLNPSVPGWYLVVSRWNGSEPPVPEPEPVYVCPAWDHSRLIVHEICSEKPAELSDFYFIGKMKLPDIKL